MHRLRPTHTVHRQVCVDIRLYLLCLKDFSLFFVVLFCYRKSLNTSRASNTSWGSDLIVLIEAGPRIEAGP